MRIKLKKVLNYMFGMIENHQIIDLPKVNAEKLVAIGWAELVDEAQPEPQAEEPPMVVVEEVKPATPKRYRRLQEE